MNTEINIVNKLNTPCPFIDERTHTNLNSSAGGGRGSGIVEDKILITHSPWVTQYPFPFKYSPYSLDDNVFLTNVHSFLIGFLTLSLMIFIFNPELLLNSIAIITSLILNL